ncbi:MAG: Fe-S-containing protein [Acidobacteria bacterium]|nr:Fe-S-containing protein [Acidobacteriota bacterium]
MARKKKLKLTWRELWPVWLAMGLLVALGVIGVWLYMPAKRKPPIQVTTEDVSVSVAAVEAVRPQSFSYPLPDSTNVQFFVRKVGGNRLQVAFAPCRKCYRSGSFTLDNQVVCGRCNEAMDTLGAGETPAPESDCKLISIPYEQANGQVIIRGHAVRELFDRWYRPVLAEPGQSH